MGTVQGDQTPHDDNAMRSPLPPPQVSSGPRSITPIEESSGAVEAIQNLSKMQLAPKEEQKADLTKKHITEAIASKNIPTAIALLRATQSLDANDLLLIMHQAYTIQSEELLQLTIEKGALPTFSQIEKAVDDKQYGMLEKLLEPYKAKEPKVDIRRESGASLILDCFDLADEKAISLLIDALSLVTKDAAGVDYYLSHAAISTNRWELAEKLLREEKRLGVALPNEIFSIGSFHEKALELKPSKEFLYLVAEQHYGWDEITRNPDEAHVFIDLIARSAGKLPDDLLPLLDEYKKRNAVHAFCEDCLELGNREGQEAFKESIAPFLVDLVKSSQSSRKYVLENPVLAAHILVDSCLNDFLDSKLAVDPVAMTAVFASAITRFPKNDARLDQILSRAFQVGASLTLPAKMAQATDNFELFWKIVKASFQYGMLKQPGPLVLAMQQALQTQDFSQIERFMIDATDPSYMREAVLQGNWMVIEALLLAGASFTPESFKDSKVEPYLAAIQEGLPRLIPLLKAQGWDINQPDKTDGYSPLVWALQSSKPAEMVAALVKNGANPNQCDWQGLAPIHYFYKNKEMRDLLVQHGADLSLPSSQGLTALHLAFELNDAESVLSLLDNGADVHKVSRYPLTPLELAIVRRSPQTLKVMLVGMRSYPLSEGPAVREAISQIGNYFKGKSDTIDLTKALHLCQTEQDFATLLHFALLVNDRAIMRQIVSQMSPKTFEETCKALAAIHSAKTIESMKFCQYELLPDHYKTTVKPVEKESEELPGSLEGFKTVHHVLEPIIDKIKTGQLSSGIEKVAIDELHPANRAYFERLDPAKIVLKAEKLLSLVNDPVYQNALLQELSEAQDASSLHKSYMQIMLYLVEHEFSQINFSDPQKPGFRDPTKLTHLGSPVTKEKLRENFTNLVMYTRDRTPYEGTPAEKTKALEIFYQKLEGELDEYVQELVSHADAEHKATVQLDLAKEVGFCAAKWKQYVSQSKNTLRGKVEVFSFEEKFYQTLQDYHSGIVHEMVWEGNVHEYNHIVSQIGQELNLADAESFVGYEDMFADKFLLKKDLLKFFNGLNTVERNVAFAKAFLQEEYKKNRDVCVAWFIEHMPKEYEGSSTDYLEEKIFDDTYNIGTQAAIQFLQQLSTPVISSPQVKA